MLTADQARERLDTMVNGDAAVGSPAHRRRLSILTAATTLFIDQGYKKTGVAEVARRAGVTKPTLYAHYPSKAHLLLHALANEKRGYMERLSGLFDDALPPRERLRCLIEQSLLLAHQMPLTARLIRGEQDIIFAVSALEEAREMAGGDAIRTEALRTSFHEELLERIAGDQLSPSQRRERAKVLVALTLSVGTLAETPALGEELSYERLASLLATMLAGGVETPESESARG